MGAAGVSRRTVFGLVTTAALLGLPSPARAAPLLTSIPVGRRPQAVAVNPVTGVCHVANTADRTVSVIVQGRTVATVPAGGVPADLSVDERTGLVYVANRTPGTTAVLDGGRVTNVVASGPGPAALALDPDTYRLYVASSETGTVRVLDLFGGALAATIEAPGRGFSSAAIDGRTGYFASLHTGTVEVLDLDTGRFTASIPVGDGPAGLAVHHGTGTVYVANSGIHHLSVVDGAQTRTILLRSEASSVAVHQASHTVYANGGPDGLVRIDGTRGEITGELALGINPGQVAVDQRTGAVHVTDPLHDRLHVITGF
ncbi:hypothetical protein ACFWQL_13560 [Amycolatopsis thermoflava]|uniref:YncE family protein n=1 Tax=Amycolatopsis thermoflava TaxID=84480 RepID=UPI0036497898